MATELTISAWAASLTKDLAPAQRQKQVAAFALTALAAAEAANRLALGYSPAYRTLVNGTASTALDRVNLNGGSIEFDFEILDDVLRWIATALHEGSPVVSGDYRNGHVVMAEGRVFDVAGTIPQVTEFVFTNVVPYARKLEIGVTESGRPFVIQVPPRLYERVAGRAAAMFSNRAAIRYGFVEVDSGLLSQWSRTSSARALAHRVRGGRPSLQGEWLRRQPAIFVKGTGQ